MTDPRRKWSRLSQPIATCVLCLATLLACAEDERNARDLLAACEAKEPYCEGFLAGTLSAHRVRDSYSMVVSGAQLLCIPDDLTLKTYVAQFIAYTKPREKELDWTGSTLALAALEHHHACHQ